MLDDINARLQTAKEIRDQHQSARGSLPQMKEGLKREAYRLQSLEACLDDVETDIRKLESATLGAMMASLLGKKESKLAERQQQLADFQQQFDECAAVVADFTEKVELAESSLTDSEAVEKAYQDLLAEKQALILNAGDEQAARLAEVIEHLACAERYRAGLEKAVQCGDHVTERIHSMSRTVGRARTKGFASVTGGALIAAAVNTAMQGGSAKPAVKRVVEGLAQFHAAINALEWGGDHPRDERVLELSSHIMKFSGEVESQGAMGMVWDTSSVGPVLDVVQEAIGHLKDVAAETKEQTKSLDDEKRQIIENT